jgi:hypothetical protein
MSGGSYDYICWDSDFELVEKYKMAQLGYMVDALRAIDIDSLAYKRTKVLYDRLREIENTRDDADRELREVWKAVEWRDSGDYGPRQAIDAVKEYELKASNRPQTR